ncbi:hypothetical protein LIER_39308 [Lithospermum erythrorhizon]|uniref:Uncharacterized protein n=1 Tax=Lithospermum erythrorhizon TaxID=34254 RepID=A0AAV3QCN0_LITER
MYEAFNRVISLTLPNSILLGSIPENLGMIQHLRFLDISNNSINGSIPFSIFHASELQSLDLSYNIISGEIHEFVGGLKNLQSLNLSDLSSNLFNSSLNPNFGGNNISYLNVSFNRISGEIPKEFAEKFPSSAILLDLSFNNLTGEIPESVIFLKQDSRSFIGNQELCGIPIRNPSKNHRFTVLCIGVSV